MDYIRSFPFRLYKVNDKQLTIVASTTEDDAYGTRMTHEFYDAVIGRAAMGYLGIPEPFRPLVVSDVWRGGMPYVTLSHLEPENEEGVVAFTMSLYKDGDYLKAKALVNRLFPKSDTLIKALSANSAKVGASIRFVDLAHRHVIGDKVVYEFIRSTPDDVCQKCASGREEGESVEFLDGVLVHIGLTTIPANSGTSVAVEERSLVDVFVEDARAILGEEFEEIKSLYKQRARTDVLETERTSADVVAPAEDQDAERAADASGVDNAVVAEETPAPDDTRNAVPLADSTDSVPTDTKQAEHDQDALNPTVTTPHYDDDILYSLGVSVEDEDESVWNEVVVLEERADVRKKEVDCYHPASHYLVVGDPEKPSTWHLPYKTCSGELDWRRIGAAYAALTKGYRGQKYKGPNAEEALRKVIALYKEHGRPLPDEDADKSRAVPEEVLALQQTVSALEERVTTLDAALRELTERFFAGGAVSVNRSLEEGRVEPRLGKALKPEEIASILFRGG